MDRIDLHIEVNRVTFSELHGEGKEESSTVVRERVMAARAIQLKRYEDLGFSTNAALNRRYLDTFLRSRFRIRPYYGKGISKAAFERHAPMIVF